MNRSESALTKNRAFLVGVFALLFSFDVAGQKELDPCTASQVQEKYSGSAEEVSANDYVPPDPLPEIRYAGDVRYMTGGVGEESAKAMRKIGKDYRVSMTFILRDGTANQFTAGVKVEIRGMDGTVFLDTTTEDPYLFVDLPAGEYVVTAHASLGEPQRRNLRIRSGQHTDLAITWTLMR